jgi:hypothetical protein
MVSDGCICESIKAKEMDEHIQKQGKLYYRIRSMSRCTEGAAYFNMILMSLYILQTTQQFHSWNNTAISMNE